MKELCDDCGKDESDIQLTNGPSICSDCFNSRYGQKNSREEE